ncbi:MAG: hypothetical protein ABIK97_01690 [candidate division WOR-3 bacterium]
MKGLVIFLSSAVFFYLSGQFENFSITAPYLKNITSSAPVGTDTCLFHLDAPPDTIKDTLGNPIGLDSVLSVWLKYSRDNQATWESLPLSRMGERFYEETWENMRILPSSGTITYYCFAIDRDSLNFATESPKNVNNTWPPTANLLAFTGDEPDNDCQIGGRANLELRDFFVSYSAEYIYIRLINNSTSWPYSAGLLGPWFIYGAAIINPRPFIRDTDYVYLAIRASINIPGVINVEPGLYRLHVDDPLGTLTRIGSIDQSISGNQLDIRFRLNDLINDPQFETYEGLIAITGATAQVSLSGEFTFADGTQPCRFYQNTHNFTIGTNNPPVLTNGQVIPRSGAPEDTFHFSVLYKDTNNHLPFIRNIYIDGTPYRIGSPDHYYLDGAIFIRSQTGFAPGWHRFHFEFSDGEYRVSTASDSFFVTGVALTEEQKFSVISFLLKRILIKGLEGRIKLRLFAANGRLLEEREEEVNGTIEVEVSKKLRRGVYFLQIFGPKIDIKKKVLLLN